MGAWIMAGVTFREAARKKVLAMALLAGLAFLALFATGVHFQVKDSAARQIPPLLRNQILNGMLMVGLYAVDLLAVVMTVLTSVDTLSGEIASGTIQAIATKPVRRWEVLLGKWAGFVGMLTAYIVIMVGGATAVTYFEGGVTAHHLLRGTCLIWLECVLMLSLTFLFGTSFSTLTCGVLALGLHGLAFIGGWIEQIGAITHSPRALNVGITASVIIPSEALWRRAAYEMQSPLVGALGVSPFSNASVPSLAMVVYAAAYLALALFFSIRRFARRDL
jgi:ABC-type transport system involved in multi-copper enzyme maturation permease subunit